MEKRNKRVTRILVVAALIWILVELVPSLITFIMTITAILVFFALFIGPFHIYSKHRKAKENT